MTREEIENIPKNVNTLLDLSVTMHTRQKLDEKLNKVCELAIKALEQEPILDKIRAEIAELRHYYPMGHDYQIAITRCIADIDKYKAESEEINGR